MNRILGTNPVFIIWALLERLHRHLYRDPNGRDPDEIDMIIVTGDGVIVNDSYFDRERIQQLVAAAGNPGTPGTSYDKCGRLHGDKDSGAWSCDYDKRRHSGGRRG